MQTSRGDFFKVAAISGVAVSVFGYLKPAYAQLKELKIARANETGSTCPYRGGLRAAAGHEGNRVADFTEIFCPLGGRGE
jgi:hypothetical protein